MSPLIGTNEDRKGDKALKIEVFIKKVIEVPCDLDADDLEEIQVSSEQGFEILDEIIEDAYSIRETIVAAREFVEEDEESPLKKCPECGESLCLCWW